MAEMTDADYPFGARLTSHMRPARCRPGPDGDCELAGVCVFARLVDGPHPVVVVMQLPDRVGEEETPLAQVWTTVDQPGIPFWFGTWEAAERHARDVKALLIRRCRAGTRPIVPDEPVRYRQDPRSALRLAPVTRRG